MLRVGYAASLHPCVLIEEIRYIQEYDRVDKYWSLGTTLDIWYTPDASICSGVLQRGFFCGKLFHFYWWRCARELWRRLCVELYRTKSRVPVSLEFPTETNRRRLLAHFLWTFIHVTLKIVSCSWVKFLLMCFLFFLPQIWIHCDVHENNPAVVVIVEYVRHIPPNDVWQGGNPYWDHAPKTRRRESCEVYVKGNWSASNVHLETIHIGFMCVILLCSWSKNMRIISEWSLGMHHHTIALAR